MQPNLYRDHFSNYRYIAAYRAWPPQTVNSATRLSHIGDTKQIYKPETLSYRQNRLSKITKRSMKISVTDCITILQKAVQPFQLM